MRVTLLSLTMVLGLLVLGHIRSADPSKPSREDQANSFQQLAETHIDGRYLRAFLVAHEAFTNETGIPADQRALENYTIYFKLEGDSYFVAFTPKTNIPGGVGGGGTELGRDVEYTIDKWNYQILKRKFFK